MYDNLETMMLYAKNVVEWLISHTGEIKSKYE